MNIVSSMIGLSLIAAATPSVMQMTLAPVEAQARATNFSSAETSAVAFSAQYEGAPAPDWSRSNVPSNCEMPVSSSSNNVGWNITCWGGEHTKRGDATDSKYYQEVKRSYRLASSAATSSLTFSHSIPGNIGSHQCQGTDKWGLNLPNGFNVLHGPHVGACIPQVAWTEVKYLNSNPEQWKYDLRPHADEEGYAIHPYFSEGEDNFAPTS